ncbi:hypothetical protein [Caldithrix abyssi]
MKKIILGFLIFWFNFSLLHAGSFYHQPPSTVLQGEKLRLELQSMDFDGALLYPTVYYRSLGEFDFHALPMENDGYLFYAEIPTNRLNPGKVQYYFAMQGPTGQPYTFPEGAPYSNYYEIEILPANQRTPIKKIEVNLISPEEDEVLEPDEVFLAFSIPLDIEHPEKWTYRITIDGVDHSSRLQTEGHVIYFTPSSVRSGSHTVSFKVYNPDGILVGHKQFQFRISDMPSKNNAFSYKGSLFLDNRTQTIARNNLNYTRSGLRLNLNYRKFQLDTRLMLNSNESADRQPLNIYSARLKYQFSYKYYLYLWGGDVFPNYDPLVLQGRRIRGLSVGLTSKFFNFDYTQGQSLRAIEGQTAADDPARIIRRGTYAQKFVSLRPQLNFGSHFSWALNLVNGRDDPASIQYGGNPKEYLVVGSSLDINLHNRRIVIHGSAQASIKNVDATGEIDFDTLATTLDLSESEKNMAERIINIFTKPGFLTLTPGLAPLPTFAFNVAARFNYFNNSLSIMYKKIDADYYTPGNPFLLKDISGIFINDYLRFFNNRIFMNIFYNVYQTSESQGIAKTSSKDIGASISLMPQSNLPSVSLTYINYKRQNDVTEEDSLFIPEDNATQSIGLSGTYQFFAGKIRNTVSVSVNHFLRDDVYKISQSQYNLFTVGLRNYFPFKLVSRFTYSKSASEFGAMDVKTTNDIVRYTIGLEYIIDNFVGNSQLKPFVNGNFQTIENSTLSRTYKRQNFAAGLYLRTKRLGNLSLRFDYINYGNFRDYKDTILSTRYELFF